jgi:hypothetical protein
MHFLFPTIYLLRKQKTTYNNYSKQQINMRHFIQANGYDRDMHAKIHYMNIHRFL